MFFPVAKTTSYSAARAPPSEACSPSAHFEKHEALIGVDQLKVEGAAVEVERGQTCMREGDRTLGLLRRKDH